jgi:tRNA(Arg) A34 adenosine deaminase TadA
MVRADPHHRCVDGANVCGLSASLVRVDQNSLLSQAFVLAAESRSDGDHPFGAFLAVDGEIVAEAHNRVNTEKDLTAHAETCLVRVLEQSDLLGELPLGIVFASCEPCPMCVGAMFWAGARRVAFGLSHGRLSELAAPPGAKPEGFTISAADIGGRAVPPMTFSGPHREDEAAQAHLRFWANS